MADKGDWKREKNRERAKARLRRIEAKAEERRTPPKLTDHFKAQLKVLGIPAPRART